MSTTHDSEDWLWLRRLLSKLVPQSYCEPGCDGLGTYPEMDADGDPAPAPCQYCHDIRIPEFDAVIQQVLAHYADYKSPTEIDEMTAHNFERAKTVLEQDGYLKPEDVEAIIGDDEDTTDWRKDVDASDIRNFLRADQRERLAQLSKLNREEER